MEWPLRHGCTVRAALLSYNLSVCFADSSPSRGASGEEVKLYEMPRPPLGRGGGSASALTERLSPAAAHGQASLRTTSQSHFVRQGRVAAPSVCCAVACILLAAAPTATPCFRRWRRSSPLPLVGEPLAKRPSFTKCQGLPSVGATATTVAEPTAASCGCWEPQPGHRVRRESYRLLYSCRGAIHPSSVSPYKHQQKEPQRPVTGTAALVYFSSRSWLTSPCLRLQQRSRQNASPGPRP